MYGSRYSQVSVRRPQAQKKMQYRSKGKSCGYYMRIVFFFSSLIQSLIIVSLVLFLLYGKKQDSASVSRIQDLEERFSQLSIENVALRQQRKNLTTLLNSTLIEKARNDWDLATIRFLSNRSVVIIDDFRNRLKQCHDEMFFCKSKAHLSGPCPQMLPGSCNCGLLLEQLKARLALVESNFTQTTQRMSREMDQTAKERDDLNLQAIGLRRDEFTRVKEVEFCRRKCKDDFAQSLSGISNVTKAFLRKVDALFPAHIAFQLTCPKQREHLEQIRTNCTSLSREVEDRFQRYLNSVGEQVSSIQAESGRLKAENWRLSDDYRWCSQNRTGMIQQHRQSLGKLQRKHDEDKERLLIDKLKLHGEIQVLENSVTYKSKEAEHLKEQLKQLNVSCVAKTGFGAFPGGSASRSGTSHNGWGMYGGGGGSSSASSSSTGGGQFGRTGTGLSLGSSGSAFSKLGSTGAGSSSTYLSSAGSDSSTGLGYNKPGSTGGALPSFGSTRSNPNLSSGGTGSIQPASSGRGSMSFGSSSGSAGSSPNLSSSGTGSYKPTSNAKSSSASGSSSGSTGSSNKSGSSNSGFSWFGLGSKPGSGTGKGPSGGSSSSSSSSGTGSVYGGGRTSGLGGSSVSVTQHLQELQRLINPARPEDKLDLSRILG